MLNPYFIVTVTRNRFKKAADAVTEQDLPTLSVVVGTVKSVLYNLENYCSIAVNVNIVKKD